jgi:hypothetical protein
MVFYTIELFVKLLSGPRDYLKQTWSIFDIFLVIAFLVDQFVYRIGWALCVR